MSMESWVDDERRWEWMQENGIRVCEVCEEERHESEITKFSDGKFTYEICKDCLSQCPKCKGKGYYYMNFGEDVEKEVCECWSYLMEVE